MGNTTHMHSAGTNKFATKDEKFALTSYKCYTQTKGIVPLQRSRSWSCELQHS